MVKGHTDSKRGNPLPPNRLFFRLAARYFYICIIHRQDNIYHGLYYTSRGALAGTRNSSMGPMTHRTTSGRSYHGATSRSPGCYHTLTLGKHGLQVNLVLIPLMDRVTYYI